MAKPGTYAYEDNFKQTVQLAEEAHAEGDPAFVARVALDGTSSPSYDAPASGFIGSIISRGWTLTAVVPTSNGLHGSDLSVTAFFTRTPDRVGEESEI